VSAKDKATGKEQQIRIQASGGLSDADIEQMVKDAEAHADEDKKKRELVDARNQADSLIHSTEKTLGEHGDKISEDDKSEIEAKVQELKDVLETDDAEDLKSKTEALMQASMKLGQAMYEAQQAEGGEDASDAPSGGDDPDVVDADFEEVDDKDKS